MLNSQLIKNNQLPFQKLPIAGKETYIIERSERKINPDYFKKVRTMKHFYPNEKVNLKKLSNDKKSNKPSKQ